MDSYLDTRVVLAMIADGIIPFTGSQAEFNALLASMTPEERRKATRKYRKIKRKIQKATEAYYISMRLRGKPHKVTKKDVLSQYRVKILREEK